MRRARLEREDGRDLVLGIDPDGVWERHSLVGQPFGKTSLALRPARLLHSPERFALWRSFSPHLPAAGDRSDRAEGGRRSTTCRGSAGRSSATFRPTEDGALLRRRPDGEHSGSLDPPARGGRRDAARRGFPGSFSPDGRSIVAVTRPLSGAPQLILIPVEAGAVRRLPASEGNVSAPSFSVQARFSSSERRRESAKSGRWRRTGRAPDRWQRGSRHAGRIAVRKLLPVLERRTEAIALPLSDEDRSGPQAVRASK